MKDIDNKGIQCAPCTCYFALTYDKRKWNYDLCAQRSLIISTVYHMGESPKYHKVWILKQNNLLQ